MWRSRPTARSRSPPMCTAPSSSRSSSSTDSPDSASTGAISAGSVVAGYGESVAIILRADGVIDREIGRCGTGGCRGCSRSIGWRGDGRDRGEQGERRGQRERVLRRDRQRGVRGKDPAGTVPSSAECRGLELNGGCAGRGAARSSCKRSGCSHTAATSIPATPEVGASLSPTCGGSGVGSARQRRARSRNAASAVAAACPIVHSKRPAAVPGTRIRCPAGRCRCWRRRLSANAVIRPAAASPDTVAPAAHGARSGASADAAPTVLELASRPTGVLVGAGVELVVGAGSAVVLDVDEGIGAAVSPVAGAGSEVSVVVALPGVGAAAREASVDPDVVRAGSAGGAGTPSVMGGGDGDVGGSGESGPGATGPAAGGAGVGSGMVRIQPGLIRSGLWSAAPSGCRRSRLVS